MGGWGFDWAPGRMPGPRLAAFFEAFAGEAAGDEVWAAAFEAELLAVCLDLDGLAEGFEAEAAGEAVVEEFDV